MHARLHLPVIHHLFDSLILLTHTVDIFDCRANFAIFNSNVSVKNRFQKEKNIVKYIKYSCMENRAKGSMLNQSEVEGPRGIRGVGRRGFYIENVDLACQNHPYTERTCMDTFLKRTNSNGSLAYCEHSVCECKLLFLVFLQLFTTSKRVSLALLLAVIINHILDLPISRQISISPHSSRLSISQT